MSKTYDLDEILEAAVEVEGSDLHLTPGLSPMVRVHGHLRPLEDYPQLSADDVADLLYSVLEPYQKEELEEEWELDFSHAVSGVSRFRGNIMRQRNSLAGVFRAIPWAVPRLGSLGLPESVEDLCHLPRGMVLVTGPTGSGKSTTLAAMVGRINEERGVNIITIEDPIEFLHEHDQAIIRQREVGTDTHSFAAALRHALRHDPDVLLIGEMRDRESVGIALTAAETGHLVLSSLHTQTASLTIHRIIDMFPEALKDQVRGQLADALQGIIAQQLLPRADRSGRVVAAEVFVSTSAARNLIREGNEHQLNSVLETGRSAGMQTMDFALANLNRRGLIDRETALANCVDRNSLQRHMVM